MITKHTMITETNQVSNQFLSHFYNTFDYWSTILLIGITYFYWQVSQVGERNKQTKQSPLEIAFITHFYMD